MSMIGLILELGIQQAECHRQSFTKIIFCKFPTDWGGWNQTHSGAMNMSSELWAHPVTCYRVPFQGGIELSAVLRRSDRIIAWGQHVNTDFTLLKQLKSHQRTLSICYNYIYYNTLRNMTTSLIDFRTKKGKNEKIQWLLRRWFFTVLTICISQNKHLLLLLQ